MSLFDPADVELDHGNFTPVPAGIYDTSIVSAEPTKTKDGMGLFLNVQLEINEGPQAGRKVFHMITLENASDEAVNIGRQDLAKICLTNGRQNRSRLVRIRNATLPCEGIPRNLQR